MFDYRRYTLIDLISDGKGSESSGEPSLSELKAAVAAWQASNSDELLARVLSGETTFSAEFAPLKNQVVSFWNGTGADFTPIAKKAYGDFRKILGPLSRPAYQDSYLSDLTEAEPGAMPEIKDLGSGVFILWLVFMAGALVFTKGFASFGSWWWIPLAVASGMTFAISATVVVATWYRLQNREQVLAQFSAEVAELDRLIMSFKSDH